MRFFRIDQPVEFAFQISYASMILRKQRLHINSGVDFIINNRFQATIKARAF